MRESGILMSITSLPSRYGIGDIGKNAYNFADFLASMKVKNWQILPVGPVGFGNSPYAARSSFAGNELLIDIDDLMINDLLDLDYSMQSTNFDELRVDYEEVKNYKWPLLIKAARSFNKSHKWYKEYEKFVKNSPWLLDYALFQSLCDYYNDSRWYKAFDEDISKRDKKAIDKFLKLLEREVEDYKILQFFFYYQWSKLKKYVNDKGIKIIGDVPIFVAYDSADVWANRKLFKLDAKGAQKAKSGVPPDAFSSDGQLWGNPLYDWPVHKKENYSWWKARLASELSRSDIIRLDHFRGFESYWDIPSDAKTAANGSWKKGPGQDFFDAMKEEFSSDLPFIAEDLGVITKEVDDLRLNNNLSGMKILQFAFSYTNNGSLDASHMYLSHNYEKNAVAYTGTHDNDTTVGWFNSISDSDRNLVRTYLQTENDIPYQMIRSLFASRARLVIIPIQDLCELDENYRMNTPATCNNSNWSYRFNYNQVKNYQIDRFRMFVEIYNRA